MSTTRQVTLVESWGGRRGGGSAVPFQRPGPSTSSSDGPARQRFSKGRGRGRGNGTGKRGRGRGRGGNSGGQCAPPAAEGVFEDDDDDVIFEAAMSHFELTTNDLSKAFEEVNASKDIPGFDTAAGDIWIYPTNRPVRDYQFNIVQTALYHNTLVSLPTGLGKTFIAAVLMYNFHRWYPNSIIVFMAPTRPLVTQQLDACHDLMGIAPTKMIELTGQTIPKKREELWKEKRVFFLTPQVMTSDLGRGFCPAEEVRCVVVDEAHKALGNHAYAQVIKLLAEKNKCFRILALSATPGNDMAAVQQVLQNLLISRVELRSETSQDILPYTHQKQVETVVVPLDHHITSIHDRMMEIFQMYTGKLMKQNLLFGRDGSSFTQFQLLRARQIFRDKPPPNIANYQRGYTEADFATCITLAHSLELILVHGLRCFYSFLHGVICKQKGTPAVAAELKKNTNVEEILADVQAKLNISAENSIFDLSTSGLFTTFSKPDTSELPEPENLDDYLLSHPKMRVLKDIVSKHFQTFEEQGQSTRIMIFSQYRDSVQEIGNMLNSLRPLVKPMVFVGQAKSAGNTSGRGLKQKEQIQVVQGFRSGGFNVLVSTCVGEEGLDIGEVDLIICFDASKSPTRLVQRMGRTGRQRQGRTIFLLAQGKEQRMYSSSVSQYSNISRTITDTSQLTSFLYKQSPRMVPAGITPQCYKMEIILSSEQRTSDLTVNQRVRAIIEKEDEPGQLRKTSKKPPSIPLKTKVGKRGPGSVGSNKTGSTGTLSIAQCFLNAKKRATTPSPKPGSSNRDSHSTAAAPKTLMSRISELEHDDSDCLIVDQHNISFHPPEPMSMTSMYGKDYDTYLRKMLGIRKVDGNTVARCVFVPKLSAPITWRPEFNDLDPKRVMLHDFEVECLREKLNAVYMMGPTSSRCDCGLVIEDALFDIEDFGVDMDTPATDYNMNKNQVEVNSCPGIVEQHVLPVPKKTRDTDIFHGSTISQHKPNCATRISEPVSNTFDPEFFFEENDPFFDDDWTGVMEEDFKCEPPMSTSTPVPGDSKKFEMRNVEKSRGNETSATDFDKVSFNRNDDSESTTISDDAFGPVINPRANSERNSVGSAKNAMFPLLGIPPSVTSNLKANPASSSDECFPPSPEHPVRLGKKKFVFQKKLKTTSKVPLQALVPMSPHSPHSAQSSPLPLKSVPPTFTQWSQARTTTVTRPLISPSSVPIPASSQQNGASEPFQLKGYVPLSQAKLPLKTVRTAPSQTPLSGSDTTCSPLSPINSVPHLPKNSNPISPLSRPTAEQSQKMKRRRQPRKRSQLDNSRLSSSDDSTDCDLDVFNIPPSKSISEASPTLRRFAPRRALVMAQEDVGDHIEQLLSDRNVDTKIRGQTGHALFTSASRQDIMADAQDELPNNQDLNTSVEVLEDWGLDKDSDSSTTSNEDFVVVNPRPNKSLGRSMTSTQSSGQVALPSNTVWVGPTPLSGSDTTCSPPSSPRLNFLPRSPLPRKSMLPMTLKSCTTSIINESLAATSSSDECFPPSPEPPPRPPPVKKKFVFRKKSTIAAPAPSAEIIVPPTPQLPVPKTLPRAPSFTNWAKPIALPPRPIPKTGALSPGPPPRNGSNNSPGSLSRQASSNSPGSFPRHGYNTSPVSLSRTSSCNSPASTSRNAFNKSPVPSGQFSDNFPVSLSRNATSTPPGSFLRNGSGNSPQFPSQRRLGKPSSSKPHVPLHQGSLPFRDIFAGLHDPDDDIPDSDIFVIPKSSTLRSPANPSPTPVQPQKRRRRKTRNGNPFVLDEADVSGDSGDSSDHEFGSDPEEFDLSFVSTEKSPRHSESQQVRYMRSVRDAYLNPRKPGKRALDELVMQGLHADSYCDYEEDSFVVRNDEVEFEDVGVFTQAMHNAQVAIDQESPNSRHKKNLRSKARNKPPEPSHEIQQPKRRKRIIVLSDDDDD